MSHYTLYLSFQTFSLKLKKKNQKQPDGSMYCQQAVT